jgi:SAM-dependent methyltransferase
LKSLSAGVLRRVGLLPPAYRVVSYLKMRRESWRLGGSPVMAGDGFPLPPTELIYQTAGTVSPAAYVESGRMTAESIWTTLAGHGADLKRVGALLDFGCGCGRVTRAWSGMPGVDVHGCDYNARLVAWCARNLPFGTFVVNGLAPPLPYSDERFGFVYAISVFTHLPEDLQTAWLAELRRVTRPGGLLLLTTHGARHFMRFAASDAQLQSFARGELVVTAPEGAGSNLCAAFHPELYVRQYLAQQWEIVNHRPDGDPGTGGQEIWLLRRSQ